MASLLFMIAVFTLCVTMVTPKSITQRRHVTADEPFAVQQTMYQIGQPITFQCSDRPEENSRRHVRWYLNGYPVTDYIDWLAEGEEENWVINSVDVYQNTLSLIALPSSETVATLFCKIDGPYEDNIVNIFHLIKAVHITPSENILGRYDAEQKCPLIEGTSLTLSCTAGLRFIQPHSWAWFRNGVHITDADEGHLQVTETGQYTCKYHRYHTHGRKELLNFDVSVINSLASPSKFKWSFCSYTDVVTS